MNNPQKVYVVSETIPAPDVLENIQNCALCGSQLHFRHKMDYLNLEVIEETQCPQCKIKSRASNFILH